MASNQYQSVDISIFCQKSAMANSDENENKDQKPAKKKSGFFTFLFNPEKFVEDFHEESSETSPAARAIEQTDQSVKTISEPLPVATLDINGNNGNKNGNGKNGHHPAPTIEALAAPHDLTDHLADKVEVNAVVAVKIDDELEAKTESNSEVQSNSETDLASEDGFSNYLNKFSYYDLLQLKSDVEQNAIHRQYLRRMRSILKVDSEERELEPWQFQRLLLMINIAHQVLNDPVTRTDYDQALIHNNVAGPKLKSAREQGRLIDIIELIRIFKILGPQTQALVTKALSERNGASDHELANKFVEDGLLSEEDLESVVLACYLLATGKINMSQLELVLGEIKETKSLLWVSLVAKGWVKMSDLS